MTTLPENIPFKVSTADPVTCLKSCDEMVIGQLGQTLDGCIATPTGDSKYINSDCGLKHLHAIRAEVDAVVVGVSCVNADNPKLNVRLCEGSNPARIILDPRGRVDLNIGLFKDGLSDVVIITSDETDHSAKYSAKDTAKYSAKDSPEIIQLPSTDFHICPKAIINALRQKGYKKILIEGGNQTLSNFIDAGVLDRLHLIVAPIIMGGGLSGLQLSPIDKLHEAMRPEVTLYPLGRDVLFDCDLKKAAS